MMSSRSTSGPFRLSPPSARYSLVTIVLDSIRLGVCSFWALEHSDEETTEELARAAEPIIKLKGHSRQGQTRLKNIKPEPITKTTITPQIRCCGCGRRRGCCHERRITVPGGSAACGCFFCCQMLFHRGAFFIDPGREVLLVTTLLSKDLLSSPTGRPRLQDDAGGRIVQERQLISAYHRRGEKIRMTIRKVGKINNLVSKKHSAD
jgi:hypothetical protein